MPFALLLSRRRVAVVAAWSGVVSALLLGGPPPAAAGSKWAPITPQESSVKGSVVDPTAGAEILHWTITLDYDYSGPFVRAIVRNQIRTKVFTQAGAGEAAAFEIEHDHGVDVQEIAARTVRPDGSVVELAKDQIYDRKGISRVGRNVDLKKFAFPSVVPGAYLDVRWNEYYYDDDAGDVRLILQRDQPVRETELNLKPLPLAGTDYHFKMLAFNMPTPHFEVAGEYQKAVLPPTPAWHAEPYVPPPFQLVPWAYFFFTYGDDRKPEETWRNFARERLRTAIPATTPDETVRAKAREIAGSAKGAREGADRLCDWIRSRLDCVTDDRLAIPEHELKKGQKTRNPADTLKRGQGSARDLTYLFVAMCKSLDLDVRIVAAADRSDVFFDRRLELPTLLNKTCAAVRDGDAWRFYDPSERWVAPGHLAWILEGEDALLLDRDKPEFVPTPLTPPESSAVIRSARLKLSADGTLEGTIRSEATGHRGVERHEAYDDLKPEARPDYFKNNLPMVSREGAVDRIEIEGADDPGQPIVERSRVRITNYAQPAGDRLLVPLSFFQVNRPPAFDSPSRRHPIYFHYPWSARDTVVIELPEGYEVEAAPDVAPLPTGGAADYRCDVLVSMDGRSVVYLRSFAFGRDDAVYFPTDQYAPIKRLFDAIRQRDEVTLSLRRKP